MPPTYLAPHRVLCLPTTATTDSTTMADNKQQQGAAAAPTGSSAAGPSAAATGENSNTPVNTAEYKKSQARVRELIEKRRLLERRLVRTAPLNSQSWFYCSFGFCVWRV